MRRRRPRRADVDAGSGANGCRVAIDATRSNALCRPSTLATLRPTMSNAVPDAQVAIGTGSPPWSVTPRSKPSSFIAIWPWSWYIVTTAS